MNPIWLVVLLSVGLFAGILLFIEIGFRIGRYLTKRAAGEAEAGSGFVDAAIFGLLGLLIGFTFSGAASRLDARRQLIVREANAISTAYFRLDMLPTDQQPLMRTLFRQYLDARLKMHDNLFDPTARERERVELARMQGEIWSGAQAACRQDQWTPAAMLLLPAINEMIDITAIRTMAIQTHLPVVIMALLFVVSLLSAALLGHSMSARTKRSPLHALLFAIVVTASIYVIIDLEYPRIGIIRLNQADKALQQLTDTIK
jgi:hypothetical protein